MSQGLLLLQKVLHCLYEFNDKMGYLSISVYELGLNAR